jgi:hypothetical protein
MWPAHPASFPFDAKERFTYVFDFAALTDASQCQDVVAVGKFPSRYDQGEARAGFETPPGVNFLAARRLQRGAVTRVVMFSQI